jgi:hypothetical protein
MSSHDELLGFELEKEAKGMLEVQEGLGEHLDMQFLGTESKEFEEDAHEK